VFTEAIILGHAAVCCTTVCVKDYAACKTTLPDVFKLMTAFSPSPHYCCLCLQLAKQQLETALRSAQRESMLITDSELAEVHYKLGRICWTMGGNELTDPAQARAHLEAATKEDSEIQVCPHNLILCGHW